jgi:hypothetical protein
MADLERAKSLLDAFVNGGSSWDDIYGAVDGGIEWEDEESALDGLDDVIGDIERLKGECDTLLASLRECQ